MAYCMPQSRRQDVMNEDALQPHRPAVMGSFARWADGTECAGAQKHRSRASLSAYHPILAATLVSYP